MAANNVKVELFYSNAWNNITADVYVRDGVRITRGRPDESQRVPPSTLSLTIDNRDGTYSPRNPTSPLYGLIGRNTPIRVSVTGVESALSLPGTSGNYASTPDNAALDITGDIDIAADLTLTDWTPAVAGAVLAKWTDPSNLSYMFGVTATGKIFLFWTTGGTGGTGVFDESTVVVPILSGRLSIRATLDVNNGGGGRTVTYYTGPSADGPWTQLGSTNGGAVTSIFSGTSQVEVGAHNSGASDILTGATIHRISVRNGISGTIVANPDFRIQAAGATTFADSAGRTWTVNGTAAIADVPSYRFWGEVESWPQRWAVDGNDVWAPITANGIMRRLNAPGTTRPAWSAMRRAVLLTASAALLGYWPLEDGSSATTGGSGIDGGTPTDTIVAPAKFGSAPIGDSGCASGVDFSSGGTLLVPTGQAVVAAPNGWEFEFTVAWDEIPAVPSGETWPIAHAVSTGAGGIMGVALKNSSGTIYWADYIFDPDGGGSSTTLTTLGAVQAGRTYHVRVKGHQVGAGLRLTVFVDGVSEFADGFDETLLMPSAIALNTTYSASLPTRHADPKCLSGLSFWAPFRASPTTYLAGNGHAGETAGERLERLCDEEGIGFTLVGDSDDSELVGPQRVVPFLDLLFDGADADGGILYEPRDSLGLAYRVHADLYNQAPVLELDYDAGGEVAPPLEPVEDTDVTANDVSVTRVNGSTARVVQETGPLNVQEPADDPEGVGRYRKDLQLTLYADSQCLQQAAWQRHLGTWDEARYPVVNVDLMAMDEAGKTALIVDAVNLDIGDRLSITDPPSWLPPDDIEQLAQGFSEDVGSHTWSIGVNATPAGPYNVLELETDTTNNLSRIPAGVTTLNEALDTTETGVDIISATTRWIDSATYASQFPFDVLIGGERMRVTACSGTGLTQTFTVTRSINGVVKSHASGTTVQLFRPPVIAR